jgi:hypothetical protein
VSQQLQDKICHICNQLWTNNQLITTKAVIAELSKLPDNCWKSSCEENINTIINFWRLSRIKDNNSSAVTFTSDIAKNFYGCPSLYQKNCRYREKLIKARREIRFLKAKMKALNSFYNRQRQEFIMRIEGMLYK